MAGQISQVYVIPKKYGTTYAVVVSHIELGKTRTIRSDSREMAMSLAQSVIQEWDAQWQLRQIKERDATNRQNTKQQQEEIKAECERVTQESKALLSRLESLLKETLSVNDTVDWEILKDKTPFSEPAPKPPVPVKKPDAPTLTNFAPTLTFFQKVIPSIKQAKENEARRYYEAATEQWQQDISRIDATNVQLADQYKKTFSKWEERKRQYIARLDIQHQEIENAKQLYFLKRPDAIISYCELVLAKSQYPDFFPQQWEIDYNPENQMLLVDYSLPAPDKIPTLVEIRYVASRSDFTEKHLTEAQRDKLYDEMVYQVLIRTLHELFEADAARAIAVITLNLFVLAIDRGTGQETNNCIASIQVPREEFEKINLAAVDAKACFRQLKGVGSSKLHSITPVAPVLRLRRDDGRFIAERDVAHQIDEGYNLASMDWKDFEHLVREVFAKEFSVGGGEVKVTQASRDGGVDAVAFDPDPIRGGKIVIQAKRYTATVDVSAVRDLYGTVTHEGAMKGILITTSDFGPDAYAFARDKPLTLMNGANLLYLLEKHGHKARIDLKEARSIAMQQGKR